MKGVATICAAAGIWLGAARACEAQSDEPLRLGKGEKSLATRVAFSPDGKWLGASARGGEILVWDMTTKRQVARLFKLDNHLYFAFSPDGGELATIDSSGRIRLWDGRQGWDRAKCVELVKPFITREPYPAYLPLAFSPDGKTLACGTPQTVRLVRASNGEQLGILRVSGEPRNLSFVEGGGTLVIEVVIAPHGHARTEVQFWDIRSFARKTQPLQLGHGGATTVSRDERLLAGIVGKPPQQAIFLWDISAHTEKMFRTDTLVLVRWVAFSPDGRMLAVVASPRSILLLDISTRKVQRTLTSPPGRGVWSVAFSPDGDYLAAGLIDSTEPVCLWRLSDKPSE